MSYLSNIAFSLELIALAVGVWLLNKSKSSEVCCAKTTKIIGYIILIGSIANMTCTLFNTFKDYTEDSPRHRGGKMERMMENNSSSMPGYMMMQKNSMKNNQQMMQQMPSMQNGQMQNGQIPNGQNMMGNQPPPQNPNE